jgi:hypothetical protein
LIWSLRCGRIQRAAVFDPFFTWLESTAFSIWMRESPSVFAFPIILAVHTIGLGFIAGISVALDLRILGAAPRIPLQEFRRFWPLMWIGLWLNVISGLALIAAYPTKALTNPLFYVKLGLIAAAFVMWRSIRRIVTTSEYVAASVDGRHGQSVTAVQLTPADTMMATMPELQLPKRLAVASLVCWAGAIAAGRFLAYTYVRLMVDSVPNPRPWIPWSQ